MHQRLLSSPDVFHLHLCALVYVCVCCLFLYSSLSRITIKVLNGLIQSLICGTKGGM
jgi:hypothetical protein